MKVRTHIIIDEKVDKKFRDKFVRKKGDYSNKIEELMKKTFGWKFRKHKQEQGR